MDVKQTFGRVTYNKAHCEGPSWILDNVAAHVAIKLKHLFPIIPTHKVSPYNLPDTGEFCQDIEWFLIRYPMKISKEDAKYLGKSSKSHQVVMDGLSAMLNDPKSVGDLALKGDWKLRPYQGKVPIILKQVKGFILADEVGLGKTLSFIASVIAMEAAPALIVVPAHLSVQWMKEVHEKTSLRAHCIYGRTPYQLPDADIYILRYSCLAHWVNVFATGFISLLGFDEAQELRRRESQKYSAAKVIRDSVKYCLPLSATPIYNYGDEIWNIMNVARPGALGTIEDFCREWCVDGRRVKDPKALGQYLKDNFFMVRRTREDVGMELPPENTIVHTVDYDKKEVQKMEVLAKELATTVLHGSFTERGQAARQLDMMARQNTGVAKARYVAAYVRMLLEAGEPVLLAGWHRDVYDIWNKELEEFNPVMITGSESPGKKEKAKVDFIMGISDLMMISLRSGSGIDGLEKRCKYLVIGELDWSPKVYTQLIGRLRRNDQEEQVTVIYLVSNCGSDPLMMDINGIKTEQADGVTDPMKAVATKYVDQSRIKLLAQQFLKKGENDESNHNGSSAQCTMQL